MFVFCLPIMSRSQSGEKISVLLFQYYRTARVEAAQSVEETKSADNYIDSVDTEI